jgi:ribosome maturation factor RimP
MSARLDQLTDMLKPSVDALGCELWGIEYQAQGRHSVLRIFIDREAGISVQDCERVSRQVSSVLDVEDPIAGEYTLEVSSPGADRPLFTLAQFEKFVGNKVSVRLRVPFEGRRNFTGLLRTVEEQDVVVVIDAEEFLLPVETIEKANIVPQYN